MSVAMFRRRVDPRKLAVREASLEGEIAPESLPRLEAVRLGGGDEEHVRASLKFGLGAGGRVLISGDIDASLMLQCQRCLEPVRVPVISTFRFAVQVGSGGEDAPQGFELLDDRGEGIVPADLVEEELLLALPFAAAHGSIEECGELAKRLASPGLDKDSKHPFAVLRDLKLD
jgi:uncharacterized protein